MNVTIRQYILVDYVSCYLQWLQTLKHPLFIHLLQYILVDDFTAFMGQSCDFLHFYRIAWQKWKNITRILIQLDEWGLTQKFLFLSKVLDSRRYSINFRFLNVVAHSLFTSIYFTKLCSGHMFGCSWLVTMLFIFSGLLWKIFKRRFGSCRLMRIGKGNWRLHFMLSSRIGYMVTY